MGFVGVGISKINSFGQNLGTKDGVGILVIGGAVATGSLALKTVAGLLSTDDAKDLGIDPSYDDTNNILAYHHIDEFFRVAPEGKLYVTLDDGSLTMDELKTAIKQHQDISFGGVVRNGDAPVDFATYIGGYQNMINDLQAEGFLLSAWLVEGVVFDPAVLISAYDDIRAMNAPKVSVVIAQDPVIRNIKTQYEKYAAIGTALGSISVRKVNENIGSVDIENKPDAYKGSLTYPLTNAGKQRWMSAVLQSGKDVSELNANEIKALNDKGYIYVGFYNGFDGFYWNDSATATIATSDYARIENNRVWDKAAKIIRQALLPRVKSNILKDPETGYLDEASATELEKLAEGKLSVMVSDKECSGVGVYIDPKQSISDNVPLVVKAKVVHNDIIHEFDVQLGLTDKL
jgi:hypothetical protein